MSASDEDTTRTELARLQGWMQAAIAHPAGVAAGVASDDAQRHVELDIEGLERVVAPSATLSAAERLAIYSRSYHARLLQCFGEMFPALCRALGEQLFNQFALDYLRRHPPQSYTLDNLADAFPQHLARTRPDADAPPGEREQWPDFVIELATLELAFLKVYDGEGSEGRTLPRVADILAADDARILAAHPAHAPSLRLFAFRYPVHTYMLAARRDETPELPAPAAAFVALTRSNYRVRLYELDASQYALLDAFDGRRTINRIINRVARAGAQTPEPPSVAVIRNWLGDWATKGFLASIR